MSLYSYLGSSKIQPGHEKIDRSHRTISFCPLDLNLTGAVGLLAFISGSRKAQFHHGKSYSSSTSAWRASLGITDKSYRTIGFGFFDLVKPNFSMAREIYAKHSSRRFPSNDRQLRSEAFASVSILCRMAIRQRSRHKFCHPITTALGSEVWQKLPFARTIYKIGPVYLGKSAIYSGLFALAPALPPNVLRARTSSGGGPSLSFINLSTQTLLRQPAGATVTLHLRILAEVTRQRLLSRGY